MAAKLKSYSSVFVFLLVIVLLTSCAQPTPIAQSPTQASTDEQLETQETGESESGEIKTGGILRIGYSLDLEGLDPARHGGGAGNITSQIFERLVDIQPDGTLKPALATSWEWVNDTQIRFHLREGVKFHSGNPFNAEVAKWSIDWLTDPDKGAIQSSYLTPLIETVEAEDEYTILITLKEPYSAFEKAAGNHLIMRDMKMYEEIGDDYGTGQVSGTGPWKFVEWQPRSYVQLERNPDWWGEGNYLDGLRFDILTEPSTRVLAFKNGDVDVLTEPSPEVFEEFANDPKYKVLTVPGDRIFKFDFDYEKPEWQNPNIRKAISLAIDKEGIVEAFVGAFGVPAKSIMTHIHESFIPFEGYMEYDPQKATDLLEAEGYQSGPDGYLAKDGQTLEVVFGVPDVGFRKDMAQTMASQLEEIGVKASVVATERGAFWGELLKDEIPFDLFDTNWGSLLDEVGMLYGHYWGPNTSPEGLNMSRRSGDPLDQMIISSKQEIDHDKRMQILKDIQTSFYDETLALVLYDQLNGWVTQSNVMDFKPHPGSFYPYQYIGVWLNQ
jgi:peptide/nickel transport system substrate-binding protein